jgi:hypothetical protein
MLDSTFRIALELNFADTFLKDGVRSVLLFFVQLDFEEHGVVVLTQNH